MHQRSPRIGFTLIELLVVIAIIATLIGMLVPAVQQARQSVLRTQCQNNLKQIGIALHTYHDARHCFPPGYVATSATDDPNFNTAPGWGWATYILPFLDQAPLFNQIKPAIDAGLPITTASVAAAIQTPIPAYLCPADATPAGGVFAVPGLPANPSYPLIFSQATPGAVRAGASSYACIVGRDEDSDADGTWGSGVFYCKSKTRISDIIDGTSCTLLIGERAWANAHGVWAGAIPGCAMVFGDQNSCLSVISGGLPNSPIFAPPMLVQAHAHLINPTADSDGGLDDLSSLHRGGANVLFADGSVHFAQSTGPDPNPGDPGAIQSTYPPPSGTPSNWYSATSYNFMAYGTRAAGEPTNPIEY